MRIVIAARRLVLALAAMGISTPSFAAQRDTSCQSWSCTEWTWPAFIVAPLILTAVLYVVGLLKMSLRRSYSHPKAAGNNPVSGTRWVRSRLLPISLFSLICFVAGWLSLIIALDSPIHEISEQLFWVHMTQHEILMLISAPLLVLGRPLAPMLWALPLTWRKSFSALAQAGPLQEMWRVISAPVSVWILSALALLIWHAPSLFDRTLQSDVMHAAQHICFLGTALLFWWTLTVHAKRLGYGTALLFVFTTAIYASVLGALLTFANRPWYASYAGTTRAWGLSPLEDQQIGGLIMWVPGGALMLGISLILLVRWMKESQQRWHYTRTAEIFRLSATPGAVNEK